MWIQNEVSISQDHVDLIVHYSLEGENHLGPSPNNSCRTAYLIINKG